MSVFRALAHFQGHCILTFSVVTAVAADTPAEDSIDSFGVPAMDIAPSGKSNVGMAVPFLGRRAG